MTVDSPKVVRDLIAIFPCLRAPRRVSRIVILRARHAQPLLLLAKFVAAPSPSSPPRQPPVSQFSGCRHGLRWSEASRPSSRGACAAQSDGAQGGTIRGPPAPAVPLPVATHRDLATRPKAKSMTWVAGWREKVQRWFQFSRSQDGWIPLALKRSEPVSELKTAY